MKLEDLIKTLIEKNEDDPDVEISLDTVISEWPLTAAIVKVVLADGMVTIYGEEE